MKQIYQAIQFLPYLCVDTMRQMVKGDSLFQNRYNDFVTLRHWKEEAAYATIFLDYIRESILHRRIYVSRFLERGQLPLVELEGQLWFFDLPNHQVIRAATGEPVSLVTRNDVPGFLADLGADHCMVISSHGEYLTELKFGNVLINLAPCQCGECRADPAYRILRFDFYEWLTHYQGRNIEDRIDILDLGYWYAHGDGVHYEPPEESYRRDHAVQQGI